jgi:hypothetical protein
VQIFRNGVLVAPCATGATGADPDPCVLSRTTLTDGDGKIVIRTSHASAWNFGRRAPYAFTGFFSPVDNLPTLNGLKAGSAVPVKFSLGGNEGLNVFATEPRSGVMTCTSSAPVDAIEQTVTAGGSALTYNVATDVYTYVWKTDKAWAVAPGGPCRQLVLRFVDGSTRRANFKFTK